MIPLAMIGAIGRIKASMSFDGSLSASGSTSTVTGTTRTITGTGTLLFANPTFVDGNPQYSKNGGAFTAISAGSTLAMADGDTLAIRCQSLASPSLVYFDLRDDANDALIQTVYTERT